MWGPPRPAWLGLAALLILTLAARLTRPLAKRHPEWASVLRLSATALATGLVPTHALPALPFLPSGASLLVNSEALLLLALALLLPLPLGRHIWVQAVAVQMALQRVLQLSQLHVALPGRGAACVAFVRAAKLAMPLAVPGAPAHLPQPSVLRCCWMAHAWAALMVGCVAPTAVLAALRQHRTRLRLMHGCEPGPGPPAIVRRHGAAACAPAQHQQHASAPAGTAASSQHDGLRAEHDAEAAPASSGTHIRKRSPLSQHAAARPPAAAAAPAAADTHGAGGDHQLSGDELLRRAAACECERGVVAAGLLVGCLARWALLSGLVGALLWALLELAAPAL